MSSFTHIFTPQTSFSLNSDIGFPIRVSNSFPSSKPSCIQKNRFTSVISIPNGASSTSIHIYSWQENTFKSISLSRSHHSNKNPSFRFNRSRKPLIGNVKALKVDISSADEDRDNTTPLRRKVYRTEDWKRHRSGGRYFRHLKTFFYSRVFASMGPPVVFLTGIATVLVVWNELICIHAFPGAFPILHFSPLPFTLSGSLLSLLLVFRTNSSYGRFDEARKMWALMLNRSRDITRQALVYMAREDNEHERPVLLQFLRHLQAFPLVYKHHFQADGDLKIELQVFTSLTHAEIDAVMEANHKPNYMLQMMSECMCSCTMNSYHRLLMDNNLITFADDIGGCERIFKTPIPLSYTRLTSRFMILWHTLLPFALYDACKWSTIPVTFLAASSFFCIEEVGVLIEEPFSILPLNDISKSVRNNLIETFFRNDTIRKNVEKNSEIEMNVF